MEKASKIIARILLAVIVLCIFGLRKKYFSEKIDVPKVSYESIDKFKRAGNSLEEWSNLFREEFNTDDLSKCVNCTPPWEFGFDKHWDVFCPPKPRKYWDRPCQLMEFPFEFELPPTVFGRSYKMSNSEYGVHVSINRDLWDIANWKQRMWVIYHEFGHAVFNFDHDEGVTIMLPNLEDTLSPTTSDEQVIFFIQEMKNRVYENHGYKLKRYVTFFGLKLWEAD